MLKESPIKLSVVVVTYRRPDRLPATLDSLLGQSFGDFELLISDDASGDATLDVAHQYAKADDRVRVRSNPYNLGMPGNLNAALRECSGDYVVNCHDGDLYAPDLFEEWVRLMDEDAEIGFSCCNWHLMRDANDIPPDPISSQPDLPRIMRGADFLVDRYFRWSLPHFGSWVWGTAIARRGVYKELGYFDTTFGFFSDVDMWMRIALRYKVGILRGVRILLPPRKEVPNLFTREGSDKIVREIFWKNRLELARRGHASLLNQVLMHGCHASLQRARLAASSVKKKWTR